MQLTTRVVAIFGLDNDTRITVFFWIIKFKIELSVLGLAVVWMAVSMLSSNQRNRGWPWPTKYKILFRCKVKDQLECLSGQKVQILGLGQIVY